MYTRSTAQDVIGPGIEGLLAVVADRSTTWNSQLKNEFFRRIEDEAQPLRSDEVRRLKSEVNNRLDILRRGNLDTDDLLFYAAASLTLFTEARKADQRETRTAKLTAASLPGTSLTAREAADLLIEVVGINSGILGSPEVTAFDEKMMQGVLKLISDEERSILKGMAASEQLSAVHGDHLRVPRTFEAWLVDIL